MSTSTSSIPFYKTAWAHYRSFKAVDYGVAILFMTLFITAILYTFFMYKKAAVDPTNLEIAAKLAWGWKFLGGVVAAVAIFYASGIYWIAHCN
jgi:hypothetical protein